MADRILVAYATRYGSTADVAEAIGDELRKAGETVDV
ncbi:MAG: flavodoxin, partial [Clostridiaceae bacterium]|nr:flavodoxin [Clostridiaceae bacterium]